MLLSELVSSIVMKFICFLNAKNPEEKPFNPIEKREFKIFKNSFNKIRFEPVYLGDKQRIKSYYLAIIHFKDFNLPCD